MGCMAQRYETELVEALPEADAVIGLDRYPELVGQLDHMTEWQPLRITAAPTSHMDILRRTSRPTPSTPYAYVKIAEGCDKGCTFLCDPAVPRQAALASPGQHSGRDRRYDQRRRWRDRLVAQDLAAYGRDIDAPGDGIVDLLRFVTDVEGLRRAAALLPVPARDQTGAHRGDGGQSEGSPTTSIYRCSTLRPSC